MTAEETGPEIPSPQDLAAFAKEYTKAYREAVEEKKPETYPQFAQDMPFHTRVFLLPNGCICMVFNSTQEAKYEGGVKDWEEVQDIVVKGVDHFGGFYPFEGRSLGDWNKRGKKDALRDLRLIDRSEMVKAGAELEGLVESITRMVKANPWLGKSGTEMISTLRNLQGRVKGGFPTVDAIASLQSMKAYSPEAGNVTIEFPDKELLEEISTNLKDVGSLQQKVEGMEGRMFEIEKAASSPDVAAKVSDMTERVDRLESQLEKVSNILTMMNSKVESYFSKTAEKERQADLERMIDEHSAKTVSHEDRIVDLEKEAKGLLEELRTMTEKADKEIHESRKRIARVEKHFVDFAKMVQE